MIVDGSILAIPRANIDTDQIIPARFLTTIDTGGMGEHCFSGMPDGAVQLGRVPKATILIAGENFGCGSSREHAVWALRERGFRAVIAPSFARIFHENAYNNGLAPIVLDEATFAIACAAQTAQINIDAQTVRFDDAPHTIAFELDPLRKVFLSSGGFLPYLAAKIPLIRAWDACRT